MSVECGIGGPTENTTQEKICGKTIVQLTFFTISNTTTNNPSGDLRLILSGGTGNDFSFIKLGDRVFNSSDAVFSSITGMYVWSNIPYVEISSPSKIIYGC